MKTWARKTLSVGFLAAGALLFAPGGVAHADVRQDNGDNSGILSGNQVFAPIDVPINACGDSLALLGGSYSQALCGNEVRQESGRVTESGWQSNGGNDGVLSGNQLYAPINLPINLCGDSLGLLGSASSFAGCSNRVFDDESFDGGSGIWNDQNLAGDPGGLGGGHKGHHGHKGHKGHHGTKPSGYGSGNAPATNNSGYGSGNAPATNMPGHGNAPATNNSGYGSGNAPSTNMPDTNMPDTNMPDTNMPDTNAPGHGNAPTTSTPGGYGAGNAPATNTPGYPLGGGDTPTKTGHGHKAGHGHKSKPTTAGQGNKDSNAGYASRGKSSI